MKGWPFHCLTYWGGVKLQEAVSEYVKIAKKHNLSPVELALGFCRDQSFVTSSIIGATSVEQLKENIDAFTTTRPLSEEVIADINAVFNRYRDPAIAWRSSDLVTTFFIQHQEYIIHFQNWVSDLMLCSLIIFIKEVSKEVEVGDHSQAVKTGLASAMVVKFIRLAVYTRVWFELSSHECNLFRKC